MLTVHQLHTWYRDEASIICGTGLFIEGFEWEARWKSMSNILPRFEQNELFSRFEQNELLLWPDFSSLLDSKASQVASCIHLVHPQSVCCLVFTDAEGMGFHPWS